MILVVEPTSLAGISPEQFSWLRARLLMPSDAETCRVTRITHDKLRNWRRNGHFRYLQTLCREDRLEAFRQLSITLLGEALSAMTWLLASPKGADKKAGLDVLKWAIQERDVVADESMPRQLINILNLRGELPAGVQALLPPAPIPFTRQPRVIDVELQGG